jgi:hypothetical protein
MRSEEAGTDRHDRGARIAAEHIGGGGAAIHRENSME